MSVAQRAFSNELGSGLLTRERLVPLALAVVAVFLAFLIAHDVFFPPAPSAAAVRTAAVTMGSVTAAVSGTGTVVPVQQQNVNFAEAGTLSEVDVKVGDQVTQGQVLARLDTTTFQQALDQANNGLASAQATLDSTLNGNALVQAQHSLAAAQQSLADAQASVDLVTQQDANAVAADQSQLTTDQGKLASANAQLQTDQAACSVPSPPASCPTTLKNDQDAVNAAQAAVNTDQSRLTTDQNKQASDRIASQRSLDQANQSVTSAQDQLNNQTVTRPNTIIQQQSAVANAQLAVQTAQRNLSEAMLTAPFSGTVLSLSGQPGDSVTGGGGGATAQSPGSTAPLPSGAGATSNSSAATGAGAASAGGGFIVLGNMTAFQVVAPFAEADAARLAPGNPATITFDAIPNLTVQAHVLAVAASSSVISNVTNYYATLAVDQLDTRLRSGMTANANVLVQSVTGVLTVTNQAITHVGSNSFVTLLGKDGKTETRQLIQTGVVGDTFTEVTGGLNVGDRVVLPQLRAPTGTTGGGGARFGGGGGGAVRLGGG